MEIYAVSSKYMAFSLSGRDIVGEEDAENYVKKILKEKHIQCWDNMSIEVFFGQDEALYIAHPLPEVKITIAPCLLSLLGEYFTE